MKRTDFSVSLLFLWLAHFSCSCFGQDNASQAELAKIVANWQARQTRHRTAHWAISGVTQTPKLSRSFPDREGRFPSEDHSFKHEIDIVVDFRGNRVRRHVERELYDLSLNRFVPEILTDVYNGREYQQLFTAQRGKPAEERGARLLLRGPVRTAAFFRHPELPILFHHGFMLPERLEPSNLSIDLPPAAFKIVQESSVDDRRVVVLQTIPPAKNPTHYSELWVDADRDYSVIRRANFRDGREYSRFEIELGLVDREWTPKKWTHRSFYFDATGKHLDELSVLTVTATENDIEVKDSHFRLDPKPGTTVQDLTVGSPGTELEFAL